MGVVLLVAGAFLVHRIVLLLAGRWLRGENLSGIADTRSGLYRGPGARLFALFCLAPTLAILAVFLYYPMFDTFQLSTQLARLGAPRTRFVCMRNFNHLLSDPDYGRTLLISFFLAVFIVVFSLTFSLLIAQMAYRPITGGRIYRALLVWPYALSPVTAGIIFQLLFHNTAGVLNHVLDSTLGYKVPWLLDPSIAPWTIVIASVWNVLGFCILFYIAGLQNVPDDLLEAAAIDGASPLQRFWRITFPLLAPITFFLVVTTTTYAFFDTYGLIDFLTAGGPVESTTTMMYEVFEVGVVARNLGSAAARSLLLFGIVIGVTIVQFRFSRGRVMYGS
jgi:sn-glycerol 3-phosphate transport system permease protein